MQNEFDLGPEEKKDVQIIPWESPFFDGARFIGWRPDAWSKKGRLLLSLGRTEAEAYRLSQNKISGKGLWRLGDQIKSEEKK